MFKSIIENTKFLPIDVSISERIFCIIYDISVLLICPNCKRERCTYLPQGRYSQTCSAPSCSKSTLSAKSKRKNTMLRRYGALVSEKTRIKAKERSQQFQTKAKTTFAKKYGVNNTSQLDITKQAKKQTMLRNWYVQYPSQSSIIQQRKKDNCIEKFGVPNIHQKNNPQAFKNLQNYEWLYHQYIVLKKSTKIIAEELGLTEKSWSTVCRYLKSHGLESRRQGMFSYMAIQWLELVMKKQSVFIQHALNLGEFKIPSTNFSVDGYCKHNNTIFEFYGDLFHGNPKVFKSDKCCHPFNPTITAGELYCKTIERERQIKSMGYTVITMWESDWNKLI